MKICPQCEKVFADNMNYCLEDGVTLVDLIAHDPQQTLSHSKDPTLQYQNRGVTNEERATTPQTQTTFGQSFQKPDRPNLFLIIGSVLGIIVLIVSGMVGGLLYLRKQREINWYPTPTPYLSVTPYRPPTPATNQDIKVEILEKVNGSFGKRYLKCKITNTSESIVSTPSITLSFYQNDVKIKDAYGSSKLKFLKPNQSVPVWVNIYGVDKYTSVKVNEPLTARTVSASEEKIFPKLRFTDTKMNAEKAGLIYNFRQYYKIYYKVGGIVENNDYEKISPQIYVLYYDEKSEIVGIEETRISNLNKEEKTKFEVSECEIDLFGTPKTFEIIAINDANY